MLTNTTASALSDSDLIAAVRENLAVLCPYQQINRDFVLDVLGATCKRASLRGHNIHVEILEFLV